MESATVTLTMAPDGTNEEIDLQSGVRDALQQMNITTSGEWLYVCQVLSIEKNHMKWSSKLAEMHEHCVSHSVVSNAICSCTCSWQCYNFIFHSTTTSVCFVLPAAAGHSVTLTGRGSISVYQQALSSVTYINTADEPDSETVRDVTFRVFDGQLFSTEVTGQVSISLVNDQPPILLCGNGLIDFIEGSTTPTYLTPTLSLVDLDVDHVITSANISLLSPQAGDVIMINASLVGDLQVVRDGQTIIVSGEGMAAQYQVSQSMSTRQCGITSF